MNQHGFVSSLNEGPLQSQAPASPIGQAEQHAGAISVNALNEDKSRKRGLGLRYSKPQAKRASGMKDPPGGLDFSGRDWIVSFLACLPFVISIKSQFSEWLLGTVLSWSADSTSCRDESTAACFPLDLEGSESKSLFHVNLQTIVPGENEDPGMRDVNHRRGLAGMRTCRAYPGGMGFTVEADPQLFFKRAKHLQNYMWDEPYLEKQLEDDFFK